MKEMRLTTVVASVNDNVEYFGFIPYQIRIWASFQIRFLAVFVGQKIPDELSPYIDNIILWDRNQGLHPVYLGQHLRIYFPALLSLPDDEMVMITDIDMLPTSDGFYKKGMETFEKDDFIYFRFIEGNQMFMCYNSAHPSVWSKLFGVVTVDDVENRLRENYPSTYDGTPGGQGWFSDQELLFRTLIHYEHLKILDRPHRRLTREEFCDHLGQNDEGFLSRYDDFHAHRNFTNNKDLILELMKRIETP